MSAHEPMSAPSMQRFLAPAHAVADRGGWQAVGVADTPAADASCEIYLALDRQRIVEAAFALYGPPVAIACADWLCEQLAGRTIGAARGLSSKDVHAALALAPAERYAAVLVIDALAKALVNLTA